MGRQGDRPTSVDAAENEGDDESRVVGVEKIAN